MATFAVTLGAEQSASSGSLTIPMPAGTLTSKLLLIYSGHRNNNGATMSDVPDGTYTEIAFTQPGTNKNSYLWGKIGTASEASQTVTWSGSSARLGWSMAISSDTGWPSIDQIVAAYSGTASGSNLNLRFAAHAISTTGNLILSLATRATTACTATSITPTAGWTAAGFVNQGPGNTLGAGQILLPPATSDIAENSVTITDNSDSGSTRGITIELSPASQVLPAKPYIGKRLNLQRM